MLLINCEVNLILTWSPNYIVSTNKANQAALFAITDAKLYVLFDSEKLFQQWKPGFKITII